jgi:hypothetical protein
MMPVNQVLDIDLGHQQLVPIDQPQSAFASRFGLACRRVRLFW